MSDLLLHEAFLAAAGRFPRRVMATRGAESVTFDEVARRVPVVARALAAAGVRRGDRVGWWGDTSLELIPLYFASAALGATFTPVNPSFGEDEARPVFDLADPRLVVVDDAHDGDIRLTELTNSSVTSGIDDESVDESDGHVMFFTSGTTGAPKAIQLSHRTTLIRALTRMGGMPEGATLSMFPMFHMSGWASATVPWLCSEEVVLGDGTDAAGMVEAMERRRVTRFYAIPAMWRRILDLDLSTWDLSSLVHADTGTSTTTVELLGSIHAALPHTTTTVTYGSTEAGSVCVLPFEDITAKAGSVGPPVAGVRLRIDDEGVLWVRSPALFEGYYRDPDATEAALVDGWYRTGEYATIDDDGYVSILGRSSEIIRTGGEAVAPAEVDVVVCSHPAIADAAVAGVANDDWGEIVTAFVVLCDGASLSLDELRRHCARELAGFKVPRQLVIVDEIPRTGATGQVQRSRLVTPG